MKIINNNEINAVSQAVQSAYPPYQELDYASLSKAPVQQAGSDFESLLPVQLDPKLESEYNAILFTRKSITGIRRSEEKEAQRRAAKGMPEGEDDETEGLVKSKGPQAPQMMRQSYSIFADYLAQVSGALNIGFAQSRYLLRNAQNFAIAQTIEDKNRMSTRYEAELEYMVGELGKEELVTSASTVFLNNLSKGNTHIIRPSQKFKGGYDILFVGNPGSLVSMRPMANNFEIKAFKSDAEYKAMKERGGHYTLPVGQAATKYSRALITAIFGADAATAATQAQRKVVVLPVDFDFKSILTSAEKNLAGTGVDPRPLATATPTFPQAFPILFKKYFSIVAVLDAPSMAINEKRNNLNATDSNVAEESLVLQPSISFSLAINLPEQIVSFITQTPPGGRIPLSALNIWATVWASAYLRKLSMKKGARDSGGIPLGSVPKYVLSASQTQKLVDRRKELGFYTENGRSNDDHLFVSNIGTFNYCPKGTDLLLDNATNYENLMEEALRVSYDAGAPLMIHQTDESHPVFGVASPDYRAKIRSFKESIKKYAGSMQAYSWDYNCILTIAKGEPDKLNSTRLAGAAIPDELSISDYLRRPFSKSMQLMFVQSIDLNDENRKRVTPFTFGHEAPDVTGMIDTTLFEHTRQFYAYLLNEKAVPDFQELVNRAAKDLEITNLQTDENHKAYEWGFDPGGRNYLYKGFLTADLKVAPDLADDVDKQMDAIVFCFKKVLFDASAQTGSNLARHVMLNGGMPEDDPHYFKPGHTLAEFKNVYNYLGGRIFYHMMKAITEVEKRKFMVVNLANSRKMVGYTDVVNEVMPFAIMMSKYVPTSDDIYQRGDAIAERNQKNEAITAEDIRVPGSKAPDPSTGKPGMQMFPHQIEGHKFLRNAPRFAVLDIAPGGGKTIEVLSDIACLVRDKRCDRPLIACPTGLVRNWVEDLHKITQGQWNVIPITASILQKWTYERLSEIIANAPRNTVCVVGYSALSRSNTFNIIIGNHVEKVSGVLEFVKKFGFDYVALDESHRVKNPGTSTHQTIKQLCTASNVKYVRLATGTLISNKLTDVVGQAAMFNSQIFRTPEEYENENHQYITGENGKPQWVWKPDTPQLARQQLARHSAVITFKRKEWAFMLPLPQEEFIPVSMADGTPEGLAHQQMYDAVLDATIEDIKAEMRKPDSELAKLIKGGEDDEEVGEEGNGTAKKPVSDDDKVSAAISNFIDKDGTIKNQGIDDATLEELSRALSPYLQRLEMLLTDPMGDEFGEKYLEALDNKNFVSNKVKKVIERIKLNFELRPWKQGGEYKKPDPSDERDSDLVLPDVCDYNGKRYVLLPAPGSENDHKLYYAPYISNTPPDVDARWKEEKYGKVIVFCRYTRSVNAIYEAMKRLEPQLAKAAVIFHGEVKGDKWAALDKFKSSKIDPTLNTPAQILIANEQAISEGHNLQMASRLVRVEAPWAPGELDQASARIFRPDPKGDYGREHIYLDWILTDRTLEVAKMGRLISKMVTKAQFDEANNPLYESMNDIQLEMKSMGLQALQEKETLADISPYIQAYSKLAQIVGREFRHMRQTKASKMFDIDPEPMFEDAKIIPFVPYVPNMAVPDRNGLGLTVMTEWLQDTSDAEVQAINADPRKLIGKYVHTEMGNGTVKGVNHTRGERRISSLVVVLDGTDDEYTAPASMIYVSPLLTPEVTKKLPKASKLSTKQKAEMEKEKARALKRAEQEEKKRKPREKRELTALQRLKQIENLKNPTKKKPVAAKPVKEELPPEEDNRIEFMPVVINGFLALDAVVFDDDIILDDAHGFTEVKDYAYMKMTNYGVFDGVMSWLEDKFYIRPIMWKRLEALHDSFSQGKRGRFDVLQAPVGDFKNFFAMYKKDSHTMSKSKTETPNSKPELKVYPMTINGNLYLTIDLKTNPVIKKYVGKTIPGVAVEKFHIGADSSLAGKIHYRFAKTNSVKEIRAMIDELVEEGFEWIEQDKFEEALADLKKNHHLKR